MNEAVTDLLGNGAIISARWLQRRGEHDGNQPALTFGARTWTYAELQHDVARLAAVLVAGGLSRGDRLAYVGPNHPLCLVAFFAATRIGAIFVPTNFRLTAHELQIVMADAAVDTVIAAPSHQAIVDEIRDGIKARRYLAFGDTAGDWDPVLALMERAPACETVPPVDADAVALIMYTSGTTGTPKGAMLTHDNVWVACINLLMTVGFADTDVALNSAPLFHVGGLCVVVLPVLLAGGHVILHEAFDPLAFMRTIAARRVTVAFAVPAMMNALLQTEGFEGMDLSSLRLLIAGGASVPASLLREFEARRIPVSQGWGMTESTATGTFLSPRKASDKLGSCGKPAMLAECRVVDFDRRPISEPEVRGELCIRGGSMMKGYWNRPEATREVLDEDGWYYSGDVGYFDAEGYYYVCDRLKDMVITGGENVYPAELEGALREHPSIADLAVIGAPDERWGERVVAVAVLRPGAKLTLEGLQDFAETRLARYKWPRELRIVNALPRNPSGKVLKGLLRQETHS